jgi:hypothetical protein
MINTIDLAKLKNSNVAWALTMTFDSSHINNLKNSITIDDVEKKLLKMVEYSDAKSILKKFQLVSDT